MSIGMDMTSELNAIAPAVEGCVQLFKRDGQVTAAWEGVLKALSQSPLMWKQRMSADNVCVHPKNRGGVGLVKEKAFSLAVVHCEAGYSYSKACDGAFAASMPPTGSPSFKQTQDANMKLNASQGIPNIAMCLGQSLGAGHGNCFLRCVIGRSECAYNAIAPSGRLDAEYLGGRYPGLKQALQGGLEWSVIHFEVFERWPLLADIAQTALNVSSTQDVNEVEGLVTMATTIKGMGDAVDWIGVQQGAQMSNPKWKCYAHAMLAICKMTPHDLILELGQLANAVLPKKRVATLQTNFLGSTYFELVASFNVPKVVVQPHRFRMALLLANLQAPIDKVDDGKCNLINQTTLKSLLGKKMHDDIMLAERAMDVARKVGASMHLLAWFDCRLVYHIGGIRTTDQADNMWNIVEECMCVCSGV
jgi:hypothetical protein